MRFSSPVAFLFVWISVTGVAGERGADPGFVPIFDGVSLTGWDGDPKYWRVEDGAITGESTAENPCTRNTFLIWRLGELDDFELRRGFRTLSDPGGRSTTRLRTTPETKGSTWGTDRGGRSTPRTTERLAAPSATDSQISESDVHPSAFTGFAPRSCGMSKARRLEPSGRMTFGRIASEWGP